MALAPIICFAYCRPDLLERTLISLSENELADKSELFIYCDGLKENASAEMQIKVKEVKMVASKKKWCGIVHIITTEKNNGLSKSIINGVSNIVNKFGKVIVVEDDVLLSKFFLLFMNEALDKYELNENVYSIGSWNYFCPPYKLKDNFFLRYPDSIAWATFARAWKNFEFDAMGIYNKLKQNKLLKYFNGVERDHYFERMLLLQVEGKIDSWAIRWTATCILNEALNFYPQYSLSKHIGFGEGATHETGDIDYNYSLLLASEMIPVQLLEIKENETAIAEWKNYIQTNFLSKYSLKIRVKKVFRNILPANIFKWYRKIKY